MSKETNDKANLDIELDKILIPILFGEEGMVKPDGSSLIDQIIYSQNSWLLKSRNKLKSLIEAEVEKVVIQNRLNTWQLFKAIHEKYQNDDADSDRRFRNDFMSEFSKFMDETTTMIKSKKEN